MKLSPNVIWRKMTGIWNVDLTETDETPTTSTATSTSGTNDKASEEDKDNSQLTLVTWNIDGLDESNLIERARGVCSYLALYSPDVVFLQEVIPPYLIYLQKRAVSYNIIPGNDYGYFTVIMLKKSRVKLLKQEITHFPTTSMMRNLLSVHVRVGGSDLCLMTSHLESTRGQAKERLTQLNTLFHKMKEVPESSVVIYGGDTNLRDQEVTKVGGLPAGVVDVWEFLGKPEHCRYTWDTKMNSNKNAAYKCQLRFDRILFRNAKGTHIIPQTMDLIGLDKLDCGKFPSDHWGLFCAFTLIL
ncbi:tyrosyl-DNA phosphodiesterase 2 isoform X2 [Protopterus annectens]|uniref:tyrosyl-DNA phosphodiesterase 2 isoform X2 n=1 Tax=Protopterus annectens TaxID=7888 RepID=UPI001CFBA059|nr:tyrosyl-DNA phosphodiesterase 2 isoform X2 [Protopterus annectens]